jgi:hypothetical protein
MNKQDAVKRIEAIEAEARALRAIIQAPEVPVRWKPNDVEPYFMVSYIGQTLPYKNVVLSAAVYAYGNCFQTREHTAIASKAVSQTLKMCAAAFAVDPDAGNFGSARCWSAVKQRSVQDGKPKWIAGQYDVTVGYPCYVHTFEQAKAMAAILNAEGV